MIEKAKQIAQQLGKHDFKGSNGWFEKWKKRFNVRMVKICGESGDVCGETVESWLERLPEIVRGYKKENIFNMDETGVFWKALPDRGFGEKSKGGKKSKHRIAVAFASAAGTKEKAVVVWNAETPRCLKRFDKSVLPLTTEARRVHG